MLSRHAAALGGGLAALALAMTLAACGQSAPSAPSNPPAPPLSARTPDEIPVGAQQLRAPIARYRRWVATQLRATSAAVGSMRAAIFAGDIDAARAQWARATRAYGAIGAAYGAFGDFDIAINGSPDGRQRNERDRRFTGLHRVELALWKRASLRDARAPARRLASDLAALRAALPRMPIDPAQYVLRAHEVLEDALSLDLTGQSARYSGRVVEAIAGRVRGTRFQLHTLDSLLRARDPESRLLATSALRRLDRDLGTLRRRDGSYPALDTLAHASRARLAGLVEGAAQALAPVPEVLDLRPPAPIRAPQDG